MMKNWIALPALLTFYFAIVVLWPKYGNVSFEGATVAVTGLILIWYAWEMFRLRVESQKKQSFH
jgi:membrane protein implicated in regulation of membrane protease activity